jgi:hypothetical protein
MATPWKSEAPSTMTTLANRLNSRSQPASMVEGALLSLPAFMLEGASLLLSAFMVEGASLFHPTNASLDLAPCG